MLWARFRIFLFTKFPGERKTVWWETGKKACVATGRSVAYNNSASKLGRVTLTKEYVKMGVINMDADH